MSSNTSLMSTIEVDHLFYFSLDKKFHMMMVTMRELAIFCVFVVAAVKGFSQDAHNIRHGQAVTKVSPLTRTSPLTTATTTSTTQLGFFNFGKPQEDEEQEEAAASKSNKETGKTTQKSGSTEEYEPDAVEKLFSFMFGKPEEEPFGLKRFGKERFPEQYPATIDDWAEPVASDSKDMAVVRPLLKNTNLESRGLMLTYSASRNGWDPMKFHQAVDRKGGALVVCTTQSGLLCGGYNPKGWVGYGEARGSIAAFLFVREPSGGFIKLRKVGGAGLAQLDYPESGPSFGADSLVIPLAKGNAKTARSKLGSYYERLPDGTNTLFGKGIAQVQLRDLKVYHGVYAEGEFIPHTDAEPFALY